MNSTLAPPQVIVNTPRPQQTKDQGASMLSISLNNFISRPKSPNKMDEKKGRKSPAPKKK